MNTEIINNHFYFIQPIKIDEEKQLKLFLNKNNKKEYKNLFAEETPEWLEVFNSANVDLMENLINVEMSPSVNFNHLKKEFKTKFFINNISLEPYFNPDFSNYYLLFDIDLKYLIFCFELDFTFKKEEFIKINSINENQDTFYSTLRNIFAKETVSSELSEWAIEIRKEIISSSVKLLNFTQNLNISENEVSIINNTCNITNIVKSNFKDKEELKSILLLQNEESERLNNGYDFFSVNNDEYLFKGRFHTIIVNNIKNIYRYVPIQFYAQFLWFYMIIINKLNSMIKEEINISSSKNLSKEEQKYLSNFLVALNKSMIHLISYNEKFKKAIESDNINIYQKIETRWNLESSLNKLNTLITFFEKTLSKFLDEEKRFLLKKLDLLENEHKELQDISSRDHLTRSFTRNVFEKDIKEIFLKKNNTLSLAFIDADKFKNINDTYGHQIGDEVLKTIVDKLFEVIRINEVDGKVYRYGGEEFLMLIENENKISVLGLLEYLRKEIENSSYFIDNTNVVKFTISIGVSFLTEEDTIESLIKRADINVYNAKSNGRNRIEY